MRRAVIVGCAGQDGSYLYDLLERRDYEIFGLGRGIARATRPGTAPPVDIADGRAVADLLSRFEPDEIYYLAAYHHSAERPQPPTRELLGRSFAVHVTYLTAFLEGMIAHCPAARLFYAASSHVFGEPNSSPQSETTPVAPTSPYGISKAAGIEVCRYYRRAHGTFCSVGILFNHESPRRGADFVSQKIVKGAVAIKRGRLSRLVLGDLDAVVDWGYAPDYVDAMTRILALPDADDFVVATGHATRVGEFIEAVFDELGLDTEDRIAEDPAIIRRPRRGNALIGDSSKLSSRTGWIPRHGIRDLARIMVAAELGHDASPR